MNNRIILYIALIALTVAAPFIFPMWKTQLATLWLFIIVALSWDMTGGQMGYNSLGNIFFYGTGMYVAAIITIALVYNVGEYTDASGGGDGSPLRNIRLKPSSSFRTSIFRMPK